MRNQNSILLGLCMLVCMSSIAQGQGERDGGKMKELRKAFLTEELSLTEEEGNKFWPVYEAFKSEKKGIRQQLKMMKSEMEEKEQKTPKDVLEFSSKGRELRVKEIDLDHQFLEQVLPILGVDRTLELRKLEKRFKNRMKERREGRGGKGSGHERGRQGPPPRN